MTYEVLTNLIGSYGFPIAAFVWVAYLLYKQMGLRAEDNERWAAAIERNTAVMEKLLDQMEAKEDAYKGN